MRLSQERLENRFSLPWVRIWFLGVRKSDTINNVHSILGVIEEDGVMVRLQVISKQSVKAGSSPTQGRRLADVEAAMTRIFQGASQLRLNEFGDALTSQFHCAPYSTHLTNEAIRLPDEQRHRRVTTLIFAAPVGGHGTTTKLCTAPARYKDTNTHG
jgi:hypothetical protein